MVIPSVCLPCCLFLILLCKFWRALMIYLYIIWSPKAGVPPTSENMVNSILPVDICDVSFLSSWSRVSPLVFLWVQNGDTKWQHVPQCPRNTSPLALALCMHSFGVLDITRHIPCRSHVHWQTQWAVVYPGILFGGGFNKFSEDRENGDLGAVAP